MAAVFDKPSLRHRMAPMVQGFDGPLAFAVFLAAFFGSRIEWRGASLRVKPDGAMASS